MYIIPFLSLAVFNLLIFLEIRRASARRAMLSTQEKKEHNLATMFLVVVLVFFICNMLPLVVNILEVVEKTNQKLIQVSNLLVNINSSVNILIYCTFGNKFKTVFMQIFCGRQPRIQTMAALRSQATAGQGNPGTLSTSMHQSTTIRKRSMMVPDPKVKSPKTQSLTSTSIKLNDMKVEENEDSKSNGNKRRCHHLKNGESGSCRHHHHHHHRHHHHHKRNRLHSGCCNGKKKASVTVGTLTDETDYEHRNGTAAVLSSGEDGSKQIVLTSNRMEPITVELPVQTMPSNVKKSSLILITDVKATDQMNGDI